MDGVFGTKSFDEGEEAEIREKAYNLCREFLNGAWRKITPADMVLKKIGGGLSNLLYYCALPLGVLPIRSEPRRALLRLYGTSHEGENVLEAHFSECVVFTMLSEKESGPRLYGIFPGGRLEQYIHGRPVTADDLQDDGLCKVLAESFAEIHKMSVPLSKEPTYLWATMNRWLTQIDSYLSTVETSELNASMVATLRNCDLRAEVVWLKQFCIAVKSPVVFCHNDLNGGNIMLRYSDNPAQKSIVPIDFEYCSYNYRAYDLANHMCESIYDYRNDHFPYFFARIENFPSREKQELFVTRYLKKFHKTDSVRKEDVDQVMEEIQRFILASHLFWAIWSVVVGSHSTITFDYWGWGAERLSAYFAHKEFLLNRTDRLAAERCAPNMENDLSTALIETSS